MPYVWASVARVGERRPHVGGGSDLPQVWVRYDTHRHVSLAGYPRGATPRASVEVRRDELERVGTSWRAELSGAQPHRRERFRAEERLTLF